MDLFYFILLSLAVWRLTHLLGKEDGPFDIVFLLRKRAGTGFFGKLLDCFYCLSLWIALPLGIWQGDGWWGKLLYWLALSGAACLLEQATSNKKNTGDDMPGYKED